MSLPFSKDILFNYFYEMIKDIVVLLFNIGLVLLVILLLVNVLKIKVLWKRIFYKIQGMRYKSIFGVFVFIIVFIIFVYYQKINELSYDEYLWL